MLCQHCWYTCKFVPFCMLILKQLLVFFWTRSSLVVLNIRKKNVSKCPNILVFLLSLMLQSFFLKQVKNQNANCTIVLNCSLSKHRPTTPHVLGSSDEVSPGLWIGNRRAAENVDALSRLGVRLRPASYFFHCFAQVTHLLNCAGGEGGGGLTCSLRGEVWWYGGMVVEHQTLRRSSSCITGCKWLR